MIIVIILGLCPIAIALEIRYARNRKRREEIDRRFYKTMAEIKKMTQEELRAFLRNPN